MSVFAQRRSVFVIMVMLAAACGAKTRDQAAAMPPTDSAAMRVTPDSASRVESLSTIAGTRVALDTTPVAAAALAVDVAASKAVSKAGERVKDAAQSGGDMVVLERGACRGGCTPYRLSLRADGKVTFTLLTDDKKRSYDSIPATPVRALLESMRTGGFASLDAAYVQGAPGCGAYAADAPIVVLTAVRGATTHSVRHDYGCANTPRALRQWGATADSISRASRFLPTTKGKAK